MLEQESLEELAHELYTAAQLAPGEGIEDAVGRLVALMDTQQPSPTPQPDSQPAPVRDYPPLPDFETVEQHIYGACRRYITQDMLEPIHNLIRDVIDADRAARAAQPLPAGEYLPLPRKAGLDDHSILPEPGFSADQMHAYVDADRAMRVQAYSVMAPAGGIPGNFITHRPAWRNALEIAKAHAKGNGVSYWEYELAVFDRSFDRLWALMQDNTPQPT